MPQKGAKKEVAYLMAWGDVVWKSGWTPGQSGLLPREGTVRPKRTTGVPVLPGPARFSVINLILGFLSLASWHGSHPRNWFICGSRTRFLARPCCWQTVISITRTFKLPDWKWEFANFYLFIPHCKQKMQKSRSLFIWYSNLILNFNSEWDFKNG